MGFTPVIDKNNGDVFTESMWDTFIRDNINWLGRVGNIQYRERTTPLTVTQVEPPLADMLIELDPQFFTGRETVFLEFFSPSIEDGSDVDVYLFTNGVISGKMCTHQNAGGAAPISGWARRTPLYGTTQFSCRAAVSSRGGTATDINAGPGGTGQFMPMYFRCCFGVGVQLSG